MPRNRFIKEVHTEQRQLIEAQELQLERISRSLRGGTVGTKTPLLPAVKPEKIHRTERRKQARKHKPARYRNPGTQSF